MASTARRCALSVLVSVGFSCRPAPKSPGSQPAPILEAPSPQAADAGKPVLDREQRRREASANLYLAAEKEIKAKTIPDAGYFATAEGCQAPPFVFEAPTIVARVEVADKALSEPGPTPLPHVSLRVLKVLNAAALDQARLALATKASPWDRPFLKFERPQLVVVPGRLLDVTMSYYPPSLAPMAGLHVEWDPALPRVGARVLLTLQKTGAHQIGADCLIDDTAENEAAFAARMTSELSGLAARLPSRRPRAEVLPKGCDVPAERDQVLLRGRSTSPAFQAPSYNQITNREALRRNLHATALETLDVDFDELATVCQVNAALLSVRGSILMHDWPRNSMTIVVPRAQTLSGLEEVAKRLRGMPGIQSARLPMGPGLN